jgi:hypothetical protein
MIAGSFSASFMSNSKWRRFFTALKQVEPPVSHLTWKFVGRDQPIRGAIPDSKCLGDRYISRTSFSVFPYKEIEWVELPGAADLPSQIMAVGQFSTSVTQAGVRVYGYR